MRRPRFVRLVKCGLRVLLVSSVVTALFMLIFAGHQGTFYSLHTPCHGCLITEQDESLRLLENRDYNSSELAGEGGAPVHLQMDLEQGKVYRNGWSRHHFNQLVSDSISVHRSLPDCRSEMCKKRVENFQGSLPQISVIFVFHNEAWSTLLRSVHSVLSRTPDHLLKEILLVDDNSSYDDLKAPLDKYFSAYPKVKIIRAPKGTGLTRARLLGYEASVAPVLVFLDAHIECLPGWVEPLLIRISENPQTVVFPIIEVIDKETFEVKCTQKVLHYGGFSLKTLLFVWDLIPQREMDQRRDETDTYRSPTMPGGLFAIAREFFQKLGTYDPGLDLWGGENIELSFKTWMCGGSLELDPCSRIGHVFRKGRPVSGSHKAVIRNSVRVAEVWMDDYKNYFYEMNNFKINVAVNVTSRQILRQTLQCRSFDWYLNTVYPEKLIPKNVKCAGEIRNVAASKMCLDSSYEKTSGPIMYFCHGLGGNQFWYVGGDNEEIWHDDWSVCVSQGNVTLVKGGCLPPDQQWQYREDRTLLHAPSGQCLTVNAGDNTVSVSACTDNNWQKWTLQSRRDDITFPT